MSNGAPGWRELRASRIARDRAAQATRRRPQRRPRDEEGQEDRPQRGKRAASKRGVQRGAPQPSTHVLSKGGIIGATIAALRGIALLLIIASTFGNYIQFVGGWDTYLPLNGTIVALAVFYQLLCSVFQWGFKAMRWWPLYAVALIASALPSYLTYHSWVGPYLAPRIGDGLVIVTIGIATIAADALPEWVLVE